MYGSSRSPPPLQHPRPQHRIQIPSQSPPPPFPNIDGPAAFTSTDDSYQRFSSPPVTGNTNQFHQPSSAYTRLGPGGGTSGAGLPDSYIPSGHSGGPGYALPQGGGTNYSGGHVGGSPWVGGGGGDGGLGGGVGGEGWPGMNDATTQMGVQFGKHAFDAGTAYLDKNFTRLLPLAHLKHSFNVSNWYVLNKLKLVLWPWRHQSWSRGVRMSETNGAAEGWKPPRDDINCPDLYIPVMALTTYILLAAVIAGSQGQFDPRILGQTASKAFGLLFLEFIFIKLGCYLLGIGDEGTVVDLVAYEGYKFVGIIVTLLAGLLGATGWAFWFIFAYVFSANFLFLLRSLRHLVLPDRALSPLDQSHSPASTTSSISHGQRSRRIQFLFTIALAQGLSMAVLVRV